MAAKSVRASERASHEPDPAASAAILDQAILTSAPRETARRFLRLSFARGVIYRPYFPSQARGTKPRTNRLFLLFGCSYRLVSYYIRYNGGFGFAEIRYFICTARDRGRTML